MATISQAEVAKAFLKELGAPTSPLMVKAVTAWMRAESGNTIRANNPWNMTLGAARETGIKPCGSWKSMSSGLVFAAFCTPQDGARASARLLLHGGNDWRGYGKVVAAARKNDPIGFLNALARSAWDGGRYGTKNGGKNKLLGIFASIGGPGVSELVGNATTGAGTAASAGKEADDKALAVVGNIGKLGGWNDIVSFPVGHILTAADIDYIMAQLASNGYFENDSAGVGQSITRAILNRAIGKAWDKSLQDSLQADFLKSASEAVPKTPLDGLSSIAGALFQIVGALFDPRKWLLFLGLLAGAGLTAYGGSNLLRAAA